MSLAGQSRARLVSSVVLSLVAFACFFHGYFPVRPLVAGYTDRQSYALRREAVGDEPFSRLVFVLVDALRSDFVFGSESNMLFAQSLVANGNALGFTAVAQPPTVTLPRLKALTTGSNPTFLDAILNVADEGGASAHSAAALDRTDSWLRQFVLRGGDGGERILNKVAFAGDDTWLRLFPRDWFAWSDGVSSFFVSDTQTVDSNVTRHLDALFGMHETTGAPPSDWDVLILHYLGLDHVGHLEGPYSSKMGPKQREMDAVFEKLYLATRERDRRDRGKTLLVLVGDHGMSEAGNHGGSTEGETSAALLLAAPSREPHLPLAVDRKESEGTYHYHEVVQQVDLVPTLSVLNSMGRLIATAVEKLRPSALQLGLDANVRQMCEVLEATGIDCERLKCHAAGRLSRSCATQELDADTSSLFLRLAQDELLVAFGDYRLGHLAGALVAFAIAALTFASYSHTIVGQPLSREVCFILLALVTHVVSFFATSFIEEEHEFWFFFGVTGCIASILAARTTSRDRLAFCAVAITIRLMRGWSHNGQKDFPNSSISASLARNPSVTNTLVGITYLIASGVPLANLALASRSLAKLKLAPARILASAIAFAVVATLLSMQAFVGLCFKLSDDMAQSVGILRSLGVASPVSLVRIGCVLGGLNLLVATLARRRVPRPAHWYLDAVRLSIASLVLMSLTRPVNFPLFVLLWLQHFALAVLSESTSPLSLASLFLVCQFCSFFAFGGSNSLATVDLSQAYNGLAAYSFPLVTVQTYLSNFSGPVFLALSRRSLSNASSSSTSAMLHSTTFFALSVAALASSAVHFRYHLFAFTVFSPAVLYRGIWWIVVHLGTNEGLSRLIMV
ncbi:hypothetical protein JCM3766R1_006829 [Sporobolomyces carnicolor]